MIDIWNLIKFCVDLTLLPFIIVHISVDGAMVPGVKRSNTIWTDSQCPNLLNLADGTAAECLQKCRDQAGCTAINHRTVLGGCSLRGCSYPMPKPQLTKAGFRGYNLGIFVALGLI